MMVCLNNLGDILRLCCHASGPFPFSHDSADAAKFPILHAWLCTAHALQESFVLWQLLWECDDRPWISSGARQHNDHN